VLVYLEAVYAQHTSYAQAMALTAATVFAITCVVAALGKERRGALFGRGAG
jgi:SHS family lactate transporter-like MFS transporter